jgi:hypothetical protein
MQLLSQNNEVVFSFGSVLRLLPGGEEVRCYFISFQNGPKKAEILVYWTSQHEFQKDEVVKSRHA